MKGVAKVIQGLLIALAGFLILLTAVDIAGYAVVPGYANGDFEFAGVGAAVAAGLIIFGLAVVVLNLATIVMFLIWSHRTTKNSFATGALGLKITPGWSIGWWFVPFANLFMPYRMVTQNYRVALAGHDPNQWQAKDAPSFLGVWWAVWLLSNFLSRIETRANFGSIDLRQGVVVLGIVSTIASLFACYYAEKVVVHLARLQETNAANGDLS